MAPATAPTTSTAVAGGGGGEWLGRDDRLGRDLGLGLGLGIGLPFVLVGVGVYVWTQRHEQRQRTRRTSSGGDGPEAPRQHRPVSGALSDRLRKAAAELPGAEQRHGHDPGAAHSHRDSDSQGFFGIRESFGLHHWYADNHTDAHSYADRNPIPRVPPAAELSGLSPQTSRQRADVPGGGRGRCR